MDQDLLQTETIFGHDGTNTDQYEDSHVMSDRVQGVATNIYREFERMIPAYGEDVVKEMMPHIVTILENLDMAFKENQEKEAELELCKDDNEQLMTQYEREKQLRKAAEQKLMAVEDTVDEERKETNSKIESLQAAVRTFELKTKNANDHITRLDEKEVEMKKEYSKLHDRYTELLKKHMDHVEKSKMLMGADRLFELGGVSPRKGQGFQLPVLRPVGSHHIVNTNKIGCKRHQTSSATSQGADFENELGEYDEQHKRRTAEKDSITDSIDVKERGTETSSAMTPDDLDENLQSDSHNVTGSRNRLGNVSSIFDELLDTDVLSEVDDGTDITGMSKEVENLILENTELLATKNALNVVKDDLIAKVDELLSEQEILREEMELHKIMKDKLKARLVELEEDLKKTKETLEIEKQKLSLEGDEDDLPMAQRKRFTRVEMARVLMERNQYKERLMELQEAVRWTEMIRASREHPDLLPGAQAGKKKSSIWNFFSNLFNSSSSKQPKKVASMPTVRYSAPTLQNRSAESSPRREKQKINERKKADFWQDEMLTDKKRKEQEQERKEQYKQLRAHVKKEDGRMQAYGWSVPAKCSPPVSKDSQQITKVKGQMPVPVPVYCKPMTDVDVSMKVWCATGVTDQLISDNSSSEMHGSSSDPNGSLVWICTTGQAGSQVTIVNASNPGSPLDKFHVSNSHILCITCVPGSTEAEMSTTEKECEENNSTRVEGGRLEKNDDAPINDYSQDGGVTIVKCKRYSDALPITDETIAEENLNDVCVDETTRVQLIEPMMWLGSQHGFVYLHSAIGNWKENLYTVKLPDSVLSISYVQNRVFLALGNGSVAVFCRSPGGGWDMGKYHLINLGKPQHSIRCMCVVDNQYVWCGYRNKVFIINPEKIALENTFDAHPRKESQIRQMVWVSEGVWISIRLDSTLRLYHALTHQHLQDVDIEPYVSKMLGTGKLGFSFVRITSLMAACNRLWIGTGNGVIICVPLSESNKQALTASIPGRPGGVFRVYRESPTDTKEFPVGSAYLPYCSMAQAQLSFHGHRDAVKFFVVLPAAVKEDLLINNVRQERSPDEKNSSEMMLVMSGGEGYIDFRVGATNTGDTDEETDDTGKDEKGGETGQGKTYLSHLIVWQVYQNS